ncbi:MAG TPA: hypothetical protein VMT24_10860 [Aggregatilineaceae bacterium]|jgi:hypothetical protein|nr:hypothetical protein [Aggregatilineaceae bacterium]
MNNERITQEVKDRALVWATGFNHNKDVLDHSGWPVPRSRTVTCLPSNFVTTAA